MSNYIPYSLYVDIIMYPYLEVKTSFVNLCWSKSVPLQYGRNAGLQRCFKHIEAWTKWTTFCRRNFENHFPQNIPSLIQIMAWRRQGDKPLSETMMVSLLTHICVTRPQWVNNLIVLEDLVRSYQRRFWKLSSDQWNRIGKLSKAEEVLKKRCVVL